MARQVYDASKPPTPGGKEADGGASASAIAGIVNSASAATTIADEAKGWAGEEARVKRAADDLKRITDFAISNKGSKLEAGSISQVRSPCRRNEVTAGAMRDRCQREIVCSRTNENDT